MSHKIIFAALLAGSVLSSPVFADQKISQKSTLTQQSSASKHQHVDVPVATMNMGPSMDYTSTSTFTNKTITNQEEDEEELGFYIEAPKMSIGYSLIPASASSLGVKSIGSYGALLPLAKLELVPSDKHSHFINDFIVPRDFLKALSEVQDFIKSSLSGGLPAGFYDTSNDFKALREFEFDPAAAGDVEIARLLAAIPDSVKNQTDANGKKPFDEKAAVFNMFINAYKKTGEAKFDCKIVTSSVGGSAGYKLWQNESKSLAASVFAGAGVRIDMMYVVAKSSNLDGVAKGASSAFGSIMTLNQREANSMILGNSTLYSRYGLYGELGGKFDYSVNKNLKFSAALSGQAFRAKYSDANILAAMSNWFQPSSEKASESQGKFGDSYEVLFGGKLDLGMELKHNKFDNIRHTITLGGQYTQGTEIKAKGEIPIKVDGSMAFNVGYGVSIDF